MNHDTPLPFALPAVARKKLTVGFDGGQLSSDGGLVLLREAERRTGIADRLAGAMRDKRDPARIEHEMTELIKTRALAICCGYEDANDLDRLRHDPLLKLAVGRAPETGAALCSQSTMSRLENAPTRIEAVRLTAALADQFCASFKVPPAKITLDIDTLRRFPPPENVSLSCIRRASPGQEGCDHAGDPKRVAEKEAAVSGLQRSQPSAPGASPA